jgi:hypothetical protein
VADGVAFRKVELGEYGVDVQSDFS